MKRQPELSEIAIALRAEGATVREVASVLGISRSYASTLYNDPTGEKDRIRRMKYRRPCPRCGMLMSAASPGEPEDRQSKMCKVCAQAERSENAVWTREAVIGAIQAFAAKYGHPPGARDWNPPLARMEFRDDISERFYADGCWPVTETVQRVFGRWNTAIRAAGFTPLEPGHKYVDRVNGARGA